MAPSYIRAHSYTNIEKYWPWSILLYGGYFAWLRTIREPETKKFKASGKTNIVTSKEKYNYLKTKHSKPTIFRGCISYSIPCDECVCVCHSFLLFIVRLEFIWRNNINKYTKKTQNKLDTCFSFFVCCAKFTVSHETILLLAMKCT